MSNSQFETLRSTALEIEQGQFQLPDFDNVLTGYSGRKLMKCLHEFSRRLCSSNTAYVELGVFQGLTLLSNAAVNRNIECFGIDNFSLFNEGRQNLSIVESRIQKLGIANAGILNMDYEEALNNLDKLIGGRKVGVFFVDGPHDYRSQLMPLLLAKRHLAENCAIFVDDANYAHVRQASADFLRANPEFAMLFEAYTSGHPANLSGATKDAALAGWWNGVNVMVRDPEGRIPRTYPREDNKHVYFESHDVFRHELAELAYPALKAAQVLADRPQAEADAALSGLKSAVTAHRREHAGRFKHQNTYSDGLPPFHIHL
jgi:hypothetical protein